MIVEVLGHATDTVAAHLRLGSVGIEHPHASVGLRALADQDQAIAADAQVPVGDFPGQHIGLRGNRFAEAIDVYVIVARALHFGEVHVRHSRLRKGVRQRGGEW